MGYAPNALLDEATARKYLDAADTDRPEDAVLELIVNGISQRIEDFTGHKYKPKADATSPRVFEHFPEDGSLDIDDCRTVEKVETTGTPKAADTWVELAPDDWVAEPISEAVHSAIRFLPGAALPPVLSGWGALALHVGSEATRTEWPAEARSRVRQRTYVRVTALWGWDAVPASVTLAAAMWLQNIDKRDVAYFSEAVGEGARPLPGEMPDDVKGMLSGEPSPTAGGIAV